MYEYIAIDLTPAGVSATLSGTSDGVQCGNSNGAPELWLLDGGNTVTLPTKTVQTVSEASGASMPTGGTYTLTYIGEKTQPISFNADAITVASALNSLQGLSGDFSVVGPVGGPWTVTIGGPYSVGVPQPMLTADGSNLTGPSGCTVMTVALVSIGTGTTPTVNGVYFTPTDNDGDGIASVAGEYTVNSLLNAVLWQSKVYSNTPTTVAISLAPPTQQYNQSAIADSNGTNQVGWAQLESGGEYCAAVWSNTAGSFVNLQQSGWRSSYLSGIALSGLKCGWIEYYNSVNNSVNLAALWSSTNVYSPLPLPDASIWSRGSTNAVSTQATGISSDGTTVSGYGNQADGYPDQALMWVECATQVTSTTSLSISTGSKTLTVASGLQYATGDSVVITESGDTSKFLQGVITSYTGTTLVVMVSTTGGSGTFASWVLSPGVRLLDPSKQFWTTFGSRALATNNGACVGVGTEDAVLWYAPNNYTILTPAGFSSSIAESIDVLGNIAGTATTSGGVKHAILWQQDVVWYGGADRNAWGDDVNWRQTLAPNAVGLVVIFGSASATTGVCDLVSGNYTVGGIIFQDNLNTLLESTFSGVLTLQGVSYALINASGQHTITADIVLNSNLVITLLNNTDTLTISGNISGAGGVMLRGAGTLTFNGTNTFQGDLWASQGVFIAGSPGAIPSGGGIYVS